ncbi:MAG: hypothetical protein NPIRA04_16360 [Nitrospirales bacterium]|nr:MAG: hypothetical protein NPIRA04_16360 [Nitrospirales bacterium]
MLETVVVVGLSIRIPLLKGTVFYSSGQGFVVTFVVIEGARSGTIYEWGATRVLSL